MPKGTPPIQAFLSLKRTNSFRYRHKKTLHIDVEGFFVAFKTPLGIKEATDPSLT